MPYDDLPNNGWGEPPEYDRATIAAWAVGLTVSLGIIGLAAYGLVKWLL